MSSDHLMTTDEIPCPTYDQLLKAARQLDVNEELALRYRQYTSPIERATFYEAKNSAFHAVKDACAVGKEGEKGATAEQLNDPVQPSSAYKTLRLFTRFALLSIVNLKARAEYVNKITTWAKGYSAFLAENPKLAAERAVALRKFARQAYLSKTSASNRLFGNLLRSSGNDFTSILERCLKDIYPDKTLKQLTKAQSIELFAKVIENSGRAKFTTTLLYAAETTVGVVVLVATLGMLVYDIVQSETDIVSKVKYCIGEVIKLGAGLAGAMAAEALAVKLFGEAATLTVFLFGVAGGVIAFVAAGFIFAGLVALFDALVSTPERNLWDEYLGESIEYKVALPNPQLDI